MGRTWLLLVVLLATGATTTRADRRAPLAGRGGASAAAVAERAFVDWRDGRRDALQALAERDDPDPWLVAHEMVLRGWIEAAESYAAAAPRPDVERLPDYVASRRAHPADPATLAALETMRADFARGDFRAALAAGAAVSGPLEDVASVRVTYGQGVAAAQLGRADESANHLLEAAAAARALGWLAQAQRAFREGAQMAYRHAEWSRALDAWKAEADVAGVRGDEVAEADALAGVGLAYARMGRYDEAFEVQQQVMTRKQVLGDLQGVAEALGNMGLLHQSLGAYDEARAAHRRALDLMRDLGNARGVAMTLGNLGILDLLQGRYREAREELEQSLLLLEALGEAGEVARTLGNLGVAYENLGDLREALDHQARALALKQTLKDRAGVATTLVNIGNLELKLGDYPEALRRQEEALRLKQELQDRRGEALTLCNLGVVYARLGRLEQALSTQGRALELMESLKDEAGATSTLANIGLLHLELGDYPRALETLHEARRRELALGDPVGAARLLGNIASVYEALGDYEQALATQQKTLGRLRELHDRVGEAEALVQLGAVYQDLDRQEDALATQQEALALMRDLQDRPGAARVLLDLGVTHLELGRAREALDLLRQAREESEAIQMPRDAARATGYAGLAYAQLGERDEAIEHLERAVREARRLRASPLLVHFIGPLARLRLKAGDASGALYAALGALQDLERLLGGLDEEQGALARAQFADLYGAGTLAAVALDKPADVLTFLESGRAGSLLESLAGRQALQWANLPEDLLREEAEAKAAVRRNRFDHERALEAGETDRVEAYGRALDEALDRLREVSARIQREAKRDAELWYPRAATLEEIQENLTPRQALVLYGLCLEEALALVVTKEDARIVRLGKVEAVQAACDALQVDTPKGDPAPALARLRALLADPLGIPESVEELLLSPEGALCYVPLGVLFPDRSVAFTPSGTTHLLLAREADARGEGVLALGAPVYGGSGADSSGSVYLRQGILSPLPGSKAEAEAVGDVVLLEQDANEETLFERVRSRPRWRAVHLACHGLVDPERPALSALVLTPHGRDDGFLTCLDLFRKRIPADLVVLSACDTGRGRVVHGEGIVGMTRAFMYAGAPRVLCSLWRVDDRATLALMKRFYQLWYPRDGSPGLPAAEALRRAQDAVRHEARWAHPYYWAAWVLWGLPD